MARIPPRGARRLQTWGPVAFFLVAVLVIGGVWFAGRQFADATTRSDTRLTAQQVRLRLEAWVDARTGLVRHMGGHRCAREHDIPAFESDATSLITASPGLLALNLVDRAGVIRVTVPRAGNERALGRDLHAHPDRGVRDALAEAQRRLVLVSSPVVQLLQGGAGLATYQPILGGDGDFLGFVNGVFRIDTLVDSCLAETSVRKHYRFRLFADDGQVAYAYDAAGETGAWPFTTTTPLRVIDRTWRLEFAPSFQTLEQRGNVFADLLALFGVALVGLLAWLLAGRLRARTALDESQARYRLLVENMADLLIRLGPDGRLLYASPSYCRMLGASEEALLAREGPLAHDGGDGPVASALAAVQSPPHTTVFEQRTTTATGPRWFAWSYRAVLDERGQVAEVVGVGRDVTARRELEEQLRQAQKMQAVGQLAGGIAHDFNNLLHAMLGFMEFAADALQPGHPAREDLGHARAAGQRAAQLTKQLLTFSRRQMLQSFDLDLNEVVENALKMLERIVSESVEIEFHPGPQELPVRGDPVQLEQVLVNLCVNARDAMGGKADPSPHMTPSTC